jgi:hypothetical protein
MKVDLGEEVKLIGRSLFVALVFFIPSVLVVLVLSKLGWWIHDLDMLSEAASDSVVHAVAITCVINSYLFLRIEGEKKP